LTRLNGKIAPITGAARGIGEAIARAFIEEGALVYLTDIETDAGEAAARNLGNRAMFRRLDVREERDWARVTAEGLSSHGRLDVVVNNAGITGFENGFVAHDPENATLDDWRAVHRTNEAPYITGAEMNIDGGLLAGSAATPG
jgi:NAD(P)-dependent dehydrogenase (short-subunit alcohol dehydrogenase family)